MEGVFLILFIVRHYVNKYLVTFLSPETYMLACLIDYFTTSKDYERYVLTINNTIYL